MYMYTDPSYQQASYQHTGYPVASPYVYSYTAPSYDVRMPREGTRGYTEREKDRKRPSHIFPQKPALQQSYTKEAQQPIDSRYFHVEGRYVPVQIVDADKLRQGREEKEKDERRRLDRREDNTPLRQSWESTDYSRKVSYRHNSGQHRDKHTYDHRRTTRVYHTNPAEPAMEPSQHGTGKYLLREEYVSRVKEYEVYHAMKWPSESRDERSRTARQEAKGYQWGKGHLRTKN